MNQTTGSDGVSTINLVSMESNQGIRLQAQSGGMNLVASGGIWSQSNWNIGGTTHLSGTLNLLVRGQQRNVATLINRLYTHVGLQM